MNLEASLESLFSSNMTSFYYGLWTEFRRRYVVSKTERRMLEKINKRTEDH